MESSSYPNTSVYNRNLIRQNTSESFKLVYLFPWHKAPVESGSPRHRSFTITLRHTTLSRTHLDEWSARRRDLYLTTHGTAKKQTSMPPAGFEPTIPGSEWLYTHSLGCTAQVSVIATENSTKCLLIFIVII